MFAQFGDCFGVQSLHPKIPFPATEFRPRITRFAILWDSSNPGMAARVRETEIAADQSHVLLHTVGPRNLDELEAAFVELVNQRPDALLVDHDRRYGADQYGLPTR